MYVCLSVTTLARAYVRHVCDKLNLPARSSLNYKGFQLADFAKKLCYSLFFVFARPNQPFLIIVVATWQFLLQDDLYLRVLKVGKWSSHVHACMHAIIINSPPSALVLLFFLFW